MCPYSVIQSWVAEMGVSGAKTEKYHFCSFLLVRAFLIQIRAFPSFSEQI
jgi:hypothetical protein